jgi:Flp pilus assembly protein TadG
MLKNHKSNDGQAILEFAYVLPFIMIVILGVIEFGVLFYDQAVVTNAAREGARSGIVFTKDSIGNYWSEATMQAKVQQAVNDYVQGRLITFGSPTSVTTTATRSGNVHADGIDFYEYAPETIGTLEVTVAYQYDYLAIPNFMGWGDSINLTAESTMRLE